jgi:hypothetical protein
MSDREAFRANRDAAKAKLHETRLKNATYTAAEVKVLTETATKVAYELGRKDAGEEIAAAADEIAESHADAARKHRAVGGGEYEAIARIHRAQASGAWEVAREVRGIASLRPGAASDATSGVGGHQEVSEAARSPQAAVEPVDDLVGALRKAVDAARERRIAERDITKGDTP